MEDSDTPNLSKPKLIPIPGLKKPEQEKKPPEPDTVDKSVEDSPKKIPLVPIPPKEPSHEAREEKVKEVRKLKLKSAITPLYAKPKKPEHPPKREQDTGDHHLEIPHAEQIPIEEIAPPTAEEMAGMAELKETPPETPEMPVPQPISEQQPPPIEEPVHQQTVEEPAPQQPVEKVAAQPVQPEEEKVQTLVKAAEPVKKRSRKPIFLVGGVAVVALLAVAYFILDPFGLDLAPIQPMSPVVSQQSTEQAVEDTDPELAIATEAPFDPESIDLDAYLAGLSTRQAQAVPNPEGVFIDRVFFAEGSTLNPHLELTLKEVEISPSEILITLTDANNVDHSIPLQRSNR